MKDLFIDFETYSAYDIRKGVYNYASHPSTEILMMAYAFGDEPVKLWLPSPSADGEAGGGTPIPEIPEDCVIHAHNANFERLIYNSCAVRDYGCSPLTVNRFRDTAALCAQLALPRALKKAADFYGHDVGYAGAGK